MQLDNCLFYPIVQDDRYIINSFDFTIDINDNEQNNFR